MDIVDAQIHIGPGRIEEVEAAMDALGIGAVLVDEEWMWGLQQQPHYRLAGGGFRPIGPTAQVTSPSDSTGSRFFQPNSSTATTQPTKPP